MDDCEVKSDWDFRKANRTKSRREPSRKGPFQTKSGQGITKTSTNPIIDQYPTLWEPYVDVLTYDETSFSSAVVYNWTEYDIYCDVD